MVKDYSNRTLAYLLLITLVISLGGTFISLNQLGNVGQPKISGSATSATGTGSLTTGSSLGLTLITSSIQFGTCYPGAGNTTVVRSNDTTNNGTGDSRCTFAGPAANPQNFTVENSGTQGINVSLQSNSIQLTGGTYNQSLWFAYVNATNSPGCYKAGLAHATWWNITTVATDNQTCANLSAGASNKRIWVFLQLYIPYDAPMGTRSATITFTGRNSYG